MTRTLPILSAWLLAVCGGLLSCTAQPQSAAPQAKATPTAPVFPPAPAAETTSGFDGGKAFAHVEELVKIGPRVPGTDGIRRAQDYIKSRLQSFGCVVEGDDFSAPTPLGRVPMKNIVAKAPGASPNVVLFLTHYDTKREPAGFVGANDSGSSTGVMLELARHACGGRKNAMTVWIAFLDGEEAYVEWTDTDSLYGSRQMAAQLANSGELKKVKAVILADLVGYRELLIKRESNSTMWLADMIWSTAVRLGYSKQFVQDSQGEVNDDHLPFLRREIPAVDIIQLDTYPHWHTAQDTLDKISPQSLATVGHVLMEVLPQLEKRFR